MSRPVKAWSLLLRGTQASSLGWYGSPCQGSETTGTQPFCLATPPSFRIDHPAILEFCSEVAVLPLFCS